MAVRENMCGRIQLFKKLFMHIANLKESYIFHIYKKKNKRKKKLFYEYKINIKI